ncbi:hypothetical protein COO59_17935 [Mixta theicola]|uniref:DUF7480 domain-containing protein n=1 Tax=Mixta theicola TaxID=1458355 RepID=A0A2K1Q5L6_9GAMM|nr:putative T6SS immunity periplasmic lipoprotein [Mixta theicola]PNS10333.1 hypothetical protein COO59_17935 [Mixta theicola]GLR07316.1 hypothetical protein GCM10007905_00350 [Mixta theicola]
MNWIRLIYLTVSLVGLTACESSILDIYPANVITVGENVCVLIAAEENEFLNGIQIVEAGQEKEAWRKYFDYQTTKDPIRLYPDRCVPDFGYAWQTGKAYSFLTETFYRDKEKVGGRNFTATFTLYRVDGKLMATRI